MLLAWSEKRLCPGWYCRLLRGRAWRRGSAMPLCFCVVLRRSSTRIHSPLTEERFFPPRALSTFDRLSHPLLLNERPSSVHERAFLSLTVSSRYLYSSSPAIPTHGRTQEQRRDRGSTSGEQQRQEGHIVASEWSIRPDTIVSSPSCIALPEHLCSRHHHGQCRTQRQSGRWSSQ